jgi:hypothetical protein
VAEQQAVVLATLDALAEQPGRHDSAPLCAAARTARTIPT